MRAPPDEETVTSGNSCSMARSIARTSFSPKTEPMLAPMKPNSATASANGRPSNRADPVMSASRAPLFRFAVATLSGYDSPPAANPSGSAASSPASHSTKLPGSVSIAIRCAAVRRKWWLQRGQTRNSRSNSRE